MIIGIGVDLVDVPRFESKIEQTPNLLARLFTDREIESVAESNSGRFRSLAGKFAAKEALVKVLQGSPELSWQEIVVTKEVNGAPGIELFGTAAEIASSRGIGRFHVSISHDGSNAIAFVVAEGGE